MSSIISDSYGATELPDSSDSSDTVLDVTADDKPRDGNCYKYLHHFLMIVCLSIGSYLGVITRIYTSIYLSLFDNIDQFTSLWAQVIGTGVIGYLVINKSNINNVLYTSLATGLCGSLTTFSTWNAESALVLLQLNESTLVTINRPDYVKGGVSGLMILFIGIGLPLSSFIFGSNMGRVFKAPVITSSYYVTGYVSSVLLYIISTTIIIIVCLITDNYYILFSLLFGPIGTYLRWRLAYFDVNFLKNDFPMGTLISNYTGSLILAGCMVARLHVNNPTVVQLINGVITGFCGCLTTVSTFISQITKLSFKMSSIYVLISLTTVQITYITIFIIYSVVY
ncbi:PREDICTED: fluoride export protein 1-like [Amphimedon queenslandica]|uniref:Fluoride ion transporter CrcB n=1 Tax=Amphimedon queenslandica TaxID=400682 RepID=A0A1X7UH47_AMPQE|nr:PREDICTED: fluoride export protein 1-like [Amphimedon queenslandica]|eukprot:XP_011405126.1 PREDICTED: fluoride export protein 1-like [Amphimedon queenslandica]